MADVQIVQKACPAPFKAIDDGYNFSEQCGTQFLSFSFLKLEHGTLNAIRFFPGIAPASTATPRECGPVAIH
jgi:hypothetical protein